jgi:protease II
MEQRFLYTTKYPNEKKVLILNDGRVLLYHRCEEGKECINKICVYDLSNGFNCDIDYELDRYKGYPDIPTYVSHMYQMNDVNIIIVHDKEIKIYKIRKKNFEQLQIFTFEDTSYEYKIFGEKFLIKNLFEKDCHFYKYEKGNLENDNKSFKIHNIEGFLIDSLGINENEFVLLYNNNNNKDSLLF